MSYLIKLVDHKIFWDTLYGGSEAGDICYVLFDTYYTQLKGGREAPGYLLIAWQREARQPVYYNISRALSRFLSLTVPLSISIRLQTLIHQ